MLAARTGDLAGTKVEGMYENAQGNATVEFLPGGKTHYSLKSVGGDCTYTVAGDKITMKVDDETTVFTMNSDGSLSGPPDSLVTRLKKRAK